ncbi:MAG: lipoyl(octanoyl) transferase LipB, partial [bacterium]
FYRDVGRFLREIEESLIIALAKFGIEAGRNPGLTGVWVGDEKIAAIGVKLSHWFTKHGFALNVHTDLSYYQNIIPCGISDKPVTSMAKVLGKDIAISDVIPAVVEGFSQVFSIGFERVEMGELL